ncbi:MAG: ATP-binding protein [Chloroflexales bacterium]|nr:ATP-binding protein [Chloroflexales bacterium]
MASLRSRLTLTHTLVALLTVVLVVLLASGLIVRAYREFSQQQAVLFSQRLAVALGQFYITNRGWDNIEQSLEQRLDAQSPLAGRRVIVVDRRERIVYDSVEVLQIGESLPPTFLRQQPSAPIQMPPRFAGRARERIVGHVIVPTTGPNNQSEPERAFLRSIIWIVVVGSGLAGGVALVVALFVSGQLTRPLRLLTQAAQRLATGERQQPLPINDRGELGDLARAFNTMTAELTRQEDLRRQLVADIAHELRTPLSVLRLQVESLADGVEQPTPQVLASLGHEVGLLSHLVDDLRLLSLVDAGRLSLSIEALDAQAALERAAAVAAPRARQAGIDLRVEPQGVLPPVRADAQRLAQILGNLVENALRYTAQGGAVTLRTRAATNDGLPSTPQPSATSSSFIPRSSVIIFEVSDTGVGIASADLPHIFDRFYRADRTRTRETGGSGLGLAIVQRLVEAQGGHVSVESTPGQGTTFRVMLPVA